MKHWRSDPHSIPSSGSKGLIKLTLAVLLLLPSLTLAQESVESQLTPPGLQQTEQPNDPRDQEKEELEVIDPSPHLPRIPGWFVILTAIIVLLPLGLLVFFFLQKKSPLSLSASSRNPFAFARERLFALKKFPPETPLAEISTCISLIIRQYLAESKSEAALYQTREEFLSDTERLHHIDEPQKSVTADFLSELASLQYAPPSSDPAHSEVLIERSLTNLDGLAQPAPHPTPVAAHD